jgi:hypothetical protein
MAVRLPRPSAMCRSTKYEVRLNALNCSTSPEIRTAPTHGGRRHAKKVKSVAFCRILSPGRRSPPRGIGFRFDGLLKTKDQIGFVSFFWFWLRPGWAGGFREMRRGPFFRFCVALCRIRRGGWTAPFFETASRCNTYRLLKLSLPLRPPGLTRLRLHLASSAPPPAASGRSDGAGNPVARNPRLCAFPVSLLTPSFSFR